VFTRKFLKIEHEPFRPCRHRISACRLPVKGKVVPVLTFLTLRHEDVWGSGCANPHFLDLGTSWR
jgi:hypothetical protein